jgi:peptide/nickel transport system substrate-binding protein
VAKKCEVVDKHTIRFTLEYAASSFMNALWNPYSLTFYIIAKECVKPDGKVIHPIGTGPFKFEEWKPGDYSKFVKFADYWDSKLPYLDEVIIKPITDPTVRLAALRSGDIDYARVLNYDGVAKLVKNPSQTPNIVLKMKEGLGITVMGWINNIKPPFNDVRVRQAFRYGIDKKELELAGTFGLGEVTNQPFSKKSPWWVDVPEKGRNLKKAKALLKEAGYPNGLDVKFLTTSAYVSWVQCATLMQDQLREIGMRVKIEVVDWPTMLKKLRAGEYQCGIGAVAMYSDPEHLYRGYLTKGGPFNWLGGHYNNPKLTKLLDKAARLIDIQERNKVYKKVVEIYDDEFPWMIVYITPHAMGWSKKLKGFTGNQNMLTYVNGGLKYSWMDK